METGDGLLVRLHPPNGILTAAQFRAVAAAARDAGNGFVDVTSRGNLQVRGVQPGSHPRLLDRLHRAGLADSRPPGGRFPSGPQRLTLVAPLAAPAALETAEAIEGATRDLAGLHPKLLVTIEDGSAAGLGESGADLAVRPDATGAPVLGLAGSDDAWKLPPASPVVRLHAMLVALAALGPCRVRDLGPDERTRLTVGLLRAPALPPAGPALAPGLHDFGGSTTLALELPFGRTDAAGLDAVAGWAATLGNGNVHLTPTRGLLLPGLSRDAAARALVAARAADLIVASDDPRRAVAACPGAPACASGAAPAQADAVRLAPALARLGLAAHVSGCAKGCAHPGAAALTLVGGEGGYGVVLDGTARDRPVAHLTLDALLARLAATDRAKNFAQGVEAPKDRP